MFVPDICSACVSDSYSKNFEKNLNKITLAVQFRDILNVFPIHSAVKSSCKCFAWISSVFRKYLQIFKYLCLGIIIIL